MREFALAALPWVLAGLAVVILCASRGKKGQGPEDERLATGMALDCCWDCYSMVLTCGRTTPSALRWGRCGAWRWLR